MATTRDKHRCTFDPHDVPGTVTRCEQDATRVILTSTAAALIVEYRCDQHRTLPDLPRVDVVSDKGLAS